MSRTTLVKKDFSNIAVSAFERTYRALFQQAHTEVDRLEKVNTAMTILERSLLDPKRIEQMDPAQQIALAELLTRSSNATIKNLSQFATLFMNIRTVVGLLDGVQKYTQVLPGDSGGFPNFPIGDDNKRIE